MQTRQLKDGAAEAFARGRFSRAAELYERYCAAEPADLQARLRLGDACFRAGEPRRAVAAYLASAEGFAREGLLPRAIAASKLVLELAPEHRGVQQMLADLYARRRASDRPAAARKGPEGVRTREAELPPELQLDAAFPGAEAVIVLSLADIAQRPPARIFMPGAHASGATAPAAVATVAPGPRPRRDVQAGLQALSRFSELELELEALTSQGTRSPPSPVPALGPGTGKTAPRAAAGPMSRRTRFTELELDDASLLRTVELAALAAGGEATEASATEEETVFSLTDVVEADGPTLPGQLPRIPLFSDLSPEEFIELFERCPLRRFREGQRILQQGSFGDAFYVICEGRVRVVREEAGDARELAVLEGGAFFGEVALLSDAPRTASVDSAADDTQLLEISAPVLTELSHRYPAVAKALKKFCRERLLRTVLSTSALFRPFGRRDRRTIVERFRARDVPRDTVLIREGTRSDGLYVVLSGEVLVTREDVALARLREGEVFGEMSLLRNVPASATVTASRRTSLLRLPREAFDALVLSHPQLLAHVSELSEDRKRQTESLLAAASAEDELMLV